MLKYVHTVDIIDLLQSFTHEGNDTGRLVLYCLY